MVPLIFEDYARDLAERVVRVAPQDILETAAGTGVVTRALASRLPANVRYVATDLNQPMLDYAAAKEPDQNRIPPGGKPMRLRCRSTIKNSTSSFASSAPCSFRTKLRVTGKRAAC